MSSFLAFAFLSVLLLSAVSSYVCNRTVSGIHPHESTQLSGYYDLCDLQLDGSEWGYYFIEDNRTKDGDVSNYTYYFNIANPVMTAIPDQECYNQTLRQINDLPEGYCPENKIKGNGTNGYYCDSALIPIDGNVGAYQVYKGNQRDNEPCWRLHDGESEPEWAFYDANDPAFGLSLTYSGGDWCGGGGINRKFKIQLLCSHDIDNIPDKEEVIIEPEVCEYAFTMRTNKGCPTECKIIEDLLCNAKGICDYDFQTSSPRCFCYFGYYGEGCELTEDPDKEVAYQDSDNSYVGALVVVILLLLVVLFILGYLFLRYSKLGKGYIDNTTLQNLKRRGKKQRIKDDEYDDD